MIICCDHQKYFGNTMSGFTASTRANFVVAGLLKAWYILFIEFNKKVFVTVRNTFLQKLSPKISLKGLANASYEMLLFVSNCDAHACHSDLDSHETLKMK